MAADTGWRLTLDAGFFVSDMVFPFVLSCRGIATVNEARKKPRCSGGKPRIYSFPPQGAWALTERSAAEIRPGRNETNCLLEHNRACSCAISYPWSASALVWLHWRSK